MKIHNGHGPFHNERIYRRLFEEQLDLNNISYLSKPKIPVYSRETSKLLGFYVLDDVGENVMIIELKVKPFNNKQGEIQLSEYVKVTSFEIGYLIILDYEILG